MSRGEALKALKDLAKLLPPEEGESWAARLNRLPTGALHNLMEIFMVRLYVEIKDRLESRGNHG